MNLKIKAEEILDINDDYRGIGYGVNTDDELRLLKEIAYNSGYFYIFLLRIIFDGTYTGKAFISVLLDKQFKNRKGIYFSFIISFICSYWWIFFKF
jgi:1-aminocyclopropane-1-carboxylate deaminase/D-cysteine desulfhydrase-like pyridoxal-dependent ACC family enzyme